MIFNYFAELKTELQAVTSEKDQYHVWLTGVNEEVTNIQLKTKDLTVEK